ncbi:MAG: DUF3422 family protein [Parahaliea sp.]
MHAIDKQWVVPGICEHPFREQLTNEIHARPSLALQAPLKVTHLALLSGEGAADAELQHVADLCRCFGAAEPSADINFWNVDLGPFHLNWERHTEFSTYSFFKQDGFETPFDDVVIDLVPQDWLRQLAGEILVAIHLAVDADTFSERNSKEIVNFFSSDNIAASSMASGALSAWSDFRLHDDGFTRFYVRGQNLEPRQTGRLVQRLLEIETYRMMALLAFPVARDIGAKVSLCENAMMSLTEQLAESRELQNDQSLLDELSQLAADVERLVAGSSYRFSAARAYYALVQRRIAELREQRLAGYASIQEFMERRLEPAMRTCESVSERLSNLSKRIARAANLLRTRVDVVLEQQNRDLLDSMNRRAKLQLRLQETVEGLSVVVLSYYLVGLIGYTFKALKAGGMAINPDLFTGLSVPLVFGLVWLGLGKVRRILLREHLEHKHTRS